MISVLLPVYNAASTLTEAVESIRSQTCQDWELLIIDDGSTDGSAGMLQPFAEEDKRIRVFRFGKNRGIVAALNHVFAHSYGDLIARMDADDISHPERLQKQKDFLNVHPQIGLVSTAVAHLGNEEKQQGYAAHINWMNGLLTHEEIYRSRFIESPFAHPSVMFRRELIKKHGGYEAGDFPEDYELWLRWMHAGVQMARLPEVLLSWRDLPQRLSRQHPMYSSDAFYRIKAKYLALWLKEKSSPRPIWVWGAGRLSRRRAELLHDHDIFIAGFTDVDPRKIGKEHEGRPVISHLDLPAPGEIFILSYVSSRGAREEIRAFLRERGYTEEKDFLLIG